MKPMALSCCSIKMASDSVGRRPHLLRAIDHFTVMESACTQKFQFLGIVHVWNFGFSFPVPFLKLTLIGNCCFPLGKVLHVCTGSGKQSVFEGTESCLTPQGSCYART